MNNEPVAWMFKHKEVVDFNKPDVGDDNWIPLYTHPVKELTDDVAKYHYNKGHEDGRKLVAVKELTNEEMRKVINKIVDGVTVSEMVTFLTISKAILRKAQEK